MRTIQTRQFNTDQDIGIGIQFYKVRRSDNGRRLYNDEGKINTKHIDVVDIDSTAVVNFTFRESALRFGIRGQFTIDNIANVLEVYELNSSAVYDLYARVVVMDNQLENLDTGKPLNTGIDVLTYITDTKNASGDYVNNRTTFYFEEALVNCWRRLTLDMLLTNNKERKYNITEFIDSLYVPELYFGYDPTTSNIIHSASEAPNTYFDITGFIAHSSLKEKSAYDIIEDMLKQTLAGSSTGPFDQYDNTGRCAYLRTQLDIETGERKVIFSSYLTDRHRTFMEDVSNPGARKGKMDYSDVYAEKFGIGPFVDNVSRDINSSIHNIIESYNVSKASPDRLRETVWGNYSFEGGNSPDPGMVFTKSIGFSDLQKVYAIKEFMPGTKINVPRLDDARLTTFCLDQNNRNTTEMSRESTKQCLNQAYNMVARSFLTVTESIMFNCRGSLLRTPNMFAHLELSTDSVKDIELVDKLYYVNGVTHIFSGNEYSNELQVSKITGSVDPLEL